MTKSHIDALPIGTSDVVYWDVNRPGFGVKVTPKGRKPHIVHLAKQGVVVLNRANKTGPFLFSPPGTKPFRDFARAKRELDELSGVKDWRLHGYFTV